MKLIRIEKQVWDLTPTIIVEIDGKEETIQYGTKICFDENNIEKAYIDCSWHYKPTEFKSKSIIEMFKSIKPEQVFNMVNTGY